MTLNTFYHESFKKWLKGICSTQNFAVSDSFDDGVLQAHYDLEREVFIIDSNQKEYPLEQVKVTLDNEEQFNSLVTEMVAI